MRDPAKLKAARRKIRTLSKDLPNKEKASEMLKREAFNRMTLLTTRACKGDQDAFQRLYDLAYEIWGCPLDR